MRSQIPISALLVGLIAVAGAQAARPAPPPAARYSEAEARTAIRLLADFYRANLRDTHAAYVRDGKIPAAVVTRKLFAEMTARGWPEARWLAVNGNPANRDNLPRDTFETEAARAVRHGEALFERREKGRLRAVAAVPFTGDCLKCHWGEKPNEYVGGISFSALLK